MPTRSCLARVAVLLLTALSGAGNLRAEEFTTIPVIVNVLKGSGVTEEEARRAIADANEILKKVKARLTVIKLNKDVTDHGNDDGALTIAEWAKVDRDGRREIRELVGEDGVRRNQKGKKIVFAGKLPPSEDGKTVVGIAQHRGSVIMFGAADIRGKTGEKGFAAQMSTTVAHEVLHNVTLAERHQVVGDPKAPKPEDFSDDDGHTSTRKENVMFPSVGGGKEVTDLQAAKIAADKFLSRFEGKPADKEEKDQPARKQKYQFGASADDPEQAPLPTPYLDIEETLLSSVEGEAQLHAFLQLGGVLPDVTFNASYLLLFDSDANPLTGSRIGGIDGVDRRLQVDLERAASAAAVAVNVRVFDESAGSALLYAGGGDLLLGKRIEEMYDAAPEVRIANHQIAFSLPKDVLDLLATEVPVTTLSIMDDDVLEAETFLFDQARHARDGTLTLGLGEVRGRDQPVPFVVEGLMPLSPFTLYLDDIAVYEGLLDELGRHSGEFLAPSSLPGHFVFVTAQDSSGEFAFNVLVTSPGTLVLLGLALCGGCVLQRPARRVRGLQPAFGRAV